MSRDGFARIDLAYYLYDVYLFSVSFAHMHRNGDASYYNAYTTFGVHPVFSSNFRILVVLLK